MLAIKQLMPTYNNPLFKKDLNEYREIIREENIFLKALNNMPYINTTTINYNFTNPSEIMVIDNSNRPNKVETKIFIGVGHETIKTVPLIPNIYIYQDKLYPDGFPNPYQSNMKANGDETVLQESATLDWLLREEKDNKHFNLIKNFKQELVNF